LRGRNSMTEIKDAKSFEQTLAQLRTEVNKANSGGSIDIPRAQSLVSKLKLAMVTNFQLVPPFSGDLNAVKMQLLLARETLELGCWLSIFSKDDKAFERYVNQLKTYYSDFSKLLPESERQWPILGLHLLGLLAHNHLSDFHTELELISPQNQERIYIKYSVHLEQWLMEGNYHKILQARSTMPAAPYKYFIDMLVDTVREKISECSEKAYESLPADDAKRLLMFDGTEQLVKFAAQRRWTITDGVIRFTKGPDDSFDIPARRLIDQTLKYATELERIV